MLSFFPPTLGAALNPPKPAPTASDFPECILLFFLFPSLLLLSSLYDHFSPSLLLPDRACEAGPQWTSPASLAAALRATGRAVLQECRPGGWLVGAGQSTCREQAGALARSVCSCLSGLLGFTPRCLLLGPALQGPPGRAVGVRLCWGLLSGQDGGGGASCVVGARAVAGDWSLGVLSLPLPFLLQ